MNERTPYHQLAERLDSLPNGFPPAPDGAEIRLLQKLYTPEEAELAAQLRITKETAAQIATRLNRDLKTTRDLLKNMARRGLIGAAELKGRLGFGLIPFIVGIYENQGPVIDEELARLFEDYYKQGFVQVSAVEPQFHRVIPVNQSIPIDITIYPHESAAGIVNHAQAWAVSDCMCRKQKRLIGEPCAHDVHDTCMILSETPGAFDQATYLHVVTREEALALLHRAAEAGMVHTLGNYRDGVSYICNCCTCSCGIIRGVSELGISNVVARSPFASQIDADRCTSCESCADACQFSALALDDSGIMAVNRMRCVGCGLCVLNCPEGAIALARRPDAEIKPVPVSQSDWGMARAAARGINLDDIL